MKLDTRIPELVSTLWSLEVTERAEALRLLIQNPTGDARVVANLVTQMGDTHVCEHIPGRLWGELRELAARALASERRFRAQKTSDPLAEGVRLLSVPVPRSPSQIERLERAHKLEPLLVEVDGEEKIASYEQRYTRLRTLGLLAIRHLDL